jgi:peptidyl-prolyl cis-trans isomerase SurA
LKRRLTPLAAALLAALALGAPALAQRLDGIAAVVNEEVILISDVEEQLAVFLMRAGAQPDAAGMQTLRQRVLDQLIEEKLIVAEAERQKITVSDAEVNREVEAAISEARDRLGSDEAFQRQLQLESLTVDKLRDKYRADVRRQMLAARLVQKQIQRKTVTPAEAEAYFLAHRDKFPKAPPEANISVILIAVEADSARVEEARQRALAALKRVRGGEKFAKVAEELSEDPTSARSGGDLGFFGRGRMDPKFEEAAFSQPIGKVGDLVRTPYGWHMIEVMERDTLKSRTGKTAGRDSVDAQGRPMVEVHARHILIRTATGPDDEERARSLARRVRDEALKGTDFAALSRRYSKLEGADASGAVGWVSYAKLSVPVRTAIDSTEVGRITELVRGPSGFSFFKVQDKRAERQYELEEIRPELPDAVSQVQFKERYDEWVKGLRAKAQITIRQS